MIKRLLSAMILSFAVSLGGGCAVVDVAELPDLTKNSPDVRESVSPDGHRVKSVSWRDGDRIKTMQAVDTSDAARNEERFDYPKEPAIGEAPPAPQQAKPAVIGDLTSIYGKWVVDVNKTMGEVAGVPLELRPLLRRDLIENPYRLEITEDFYVAESKGVKNKNRYRVESKEGDRVKLGLYPEGSTESERYAVLAVRNGVIHIITSDDKTIVMRRSR